MAACSLRQRCGYSETGMIGWEDCVVIFLRSSFFDLKNWRKLITRVFIQKIVIAHGVGAVWQKPILAKSVRGERTLPKIGEEETVLAREASD